MEKVKARGVLESLSYSVCYSTWKKSRPSLVTDMPAAWLQVSQLSSSRAKTLKQLRQQLAFNSDEKGASALTRDVQTCFIFRCPGGIKHSRLHGVFYLLFPPLELCPRATDKQQWCLYKAKCPLAHLGTVGDNEKVIWGLCNYYFISLNREDGKKKKKKGWCI